MNLKLFFKCGIIILTTLIFIYAFSASYNSENIDRLDYVIALGIDSVPDSDNLAVSFEFANLSSFSENSSSKDSKPIINTIEAPSISRAINIMNAYIGKQLNLSHCKVIVFSKSFAEKGIMKDISVLMHNTQIRPTTNIIISEGNANEYIESSTSSLEQVLTKFYDVFPTSSEYTGYTSNVPLGKFYDSLSNDDIETVAILGKKSKVSTKSNESSLQNSSNGGGSSSDEQSPNGEEGFSEGESTGSADVGGGDSKDPSSNAKENNTKDTVIDESAILEGDRGTLNVGLGVFKNDRYIGTLTAEETLYYSLLKNEVDIFLLSIPDPFEEGKKIDLSMWSLSDSKFDTDVSNDTPKITIKLNLTAKVLTQLNMTELSYDETMNKLNSSLKDYLSKQISDYLYKTSKGYNTDINEFYSIAKRKFLTTQKFEDYKWQQKYENAEFNIEFNDNVVSSILIRN